MIESKSIETPATLVRFSIRAPQTGASVGDADGPFTKLYHEESDRSKRFSYIHVSALGVANRTLLLRQSRGLSDRSKTAKRKPGASKNDQKCSNLYISGDETRFQRILKKVVFDADCYQDSEKTMDIVQKPSTQNVQICTSVVIKKKKERLILEGRFDQLFTNIISKLI